MEIYAFIMRNDLGIMTSERLRKLNSVEEGIQ